VEANTLRAIANRQKRADFVGSEAANVAQIDHGTLADRQRGDLPDHDLEELPVEHAVLRGVRRVGTRGPRGRLGID
jgi:hypothetical protein